MRTLSMNQHPVRLRHHAVCVKHIGDCAIDQISEKEVVMYPNRNRVWPLTLFVALCLVGCDGQLPDLVVEKPPTQPPYCQSKDGKLVVTVKNQGTVAAPASLTRVEFRGTPVTMSTPAIPPNGSVAVEFVTPKECWRPDCSFKICVDSTNQVKETNEGNNCVDGSCIG